ncbi:hypothetical protein [Mycoplasma nasistruthionis]|uniref:Lipoprotein n=1 Tax=Mycoplasma nasistruthionis TaxID=353852 RepID=A0A4Y6I7J1_9MOLU|nr:hypothetical protein [Mycoplasma nasistruthionis]QDF64878.1 hypothetical protein FIV53_00930 [Mycoplasma nasistruthionis]
MKKKWLRLGGVLVFGSSSILGVVACENTADAKQQNHYQDKVEELKTIANKIGVSTPQYQEINAFITQVNKKISRNTSASEIQNLIKQIQAKIDQFIDLANQIETVKNNKLNEIDFSSLTPSLKANIGANKSVYSASTEDYQLPQNSLETETYNVFYNDNLEVVDLAKIVKTSDDLNKINEALDLINQGKSLVKVSFYAIHKKYPENKIYFDKTFEIGGYLTKTQALKDIEAEVNKLNITQKLGTSLQIEVNNALETDSALAKLIQGTYESESLKSALSIPVDYKYNISVQLVKADVVSGKVWLNVVGSLKEQPDGFKYYRSTDNQNNLLVANLNDSAKLRLTPAAYSNLFNLENFIVIDETKLLQSLNKSAMSEVKMAELTPEIIKNSLKLSTTQFTEKSNKFTYTVPETLLSDLNVSVTSPRLQAKGDGNYFVYDLNLTLPENPVGIYADKDGNVLSQIFDDQKTTSVTFTLNSYTVTEEDIQRSITKRNQEFADRTFDYSAFRNEIIESAQNEYPSVFLTRNASQVFMASMMSMVAQLQLSEKEIDKPYNDAIFVINKNQNSYEKTLAGEKQRFNFKVLLDKYGDVLKTKADGSLNLEDGRVLVAENTGRVTSTIKNVDYNDYPKSPAELEAYLKPYLDKGITKFDFYVPDISLSQMEYRDTYKTLLKYANKVVILSDGNAQPYYFVNSNYAQFVNGQKGLQVKDASQLARYWENYHNDTGDKIHFQNFLRYTDKVRIYNITGKYVEYFKKQFAQRGVEWANFKIEDSPLNYTTLAKSIDNIDTVRYIDELTSLYNLKGKSFEDLIVSGANNLDKSKKNLVFIGSSLFTKLRGELRLKTQEIPRAEIHKYFNKMLELYPTSEYNYIYKLHPAFRDADAVEFIKEFTNGHENEAIILDPSISWENIVAAEAERIATNTSVLFDANDFKNGQSKTQLFGVQPSSTVLLATIAMLRDIFQITTDQATLMVNPPNFPISEAFNMIYRDQYFSEERKDAAYNTNIQLLNNVYKYFVYTNEFPELSSFPRMSKFLERTRQTSENNATENPQS